MRRHHLHTLIATLIFFLLGGSFAATASAGWGRSSDHRARYNDHDRYGDHHRADERQRIATLAIQLDRAADRLHRGAELSAHHPTRRTARALYDLHCLAEAADHFRNRVLRRRTLYGIDRQLDELLDALRTVERSFYSLNPPRRVEEDFYAVDHLVVELTWALEGYSANTGASATPYYDRDRSRGVVWLRPKQTTPRGYR